MLGDLDELVLQCRGTGARSRIGEAVRAYKAMAYRSAIIMTWVALAFDIVDKFRELALLGDTAAAKTVEEFDRLHREDDLKASLAFERELLVTAKTAFELISETEYIELARVQQDRNRCAHPSLNASGDAFEPTAELARAHIRAAIEYVLRHEPSQGRAALQALVEMVRGEYFPFDLEKSNAALAHTPLAAGRRGLVRNFCVVMLKDLLKESLDFANTTKRLNALDFIRTCRPDLWDDTMPTEISQLAGSLKVKQHGLAIMRVLARFPAAWAWLPPTVTTGLELYARDIPDSDITLLGPLEQIPALVNPLYQRAMKVSPDQFDEWFWETPPQVIIRAIVVRLSIVAEPDVVDIWLNGLHTLYAFQSGHLREREANILFKAIISNKVLQQHPRLDELLRLALLDKCGKGETWDRMLAKLGRDPAIYQETKP